MSTSGNYIFVLWGNDFDEAMATIFVTEFRRAGLRVKVVGLTQRRTTGACGLALLPDLTLEQALPLAGDTTCLVVPCNSTGSKWLGHDPRLIEFFGQLHANQAKFVIGQMDEAGLKIFPSKIEKIIVDPRSENLIKFARWLVGSLSKAI